MTIEQRVAVLEEIFSRIQDYYTSAYSGEEIDARLASAGVPVGITKEYKSITEMNQDFTGTDVQRGQFVLILPDSTASADYGKVYLKGTANWVYAFTLTTLTSIKGPVGPPGKKGDQGDPGEAGSSFAILGYFDTLDALKAAVPYPKAGDVYGVGTTPPYNIYIWDSVHGKWVPNGNLQGPVGGSSNFIRYDAAQSLSDTQKAQARGNIGAAPRGGGVMESTIAVSASSASESYDTFCAKLDKILETMPNGSVKFLRVYPPQYYTYGADMCALYKSDNNYASVYTIGSYNYGRQGFRMVKRKLYSSDPAGQWDPLEYINPDMKLGVEYRTTERYQGKPVYLKIVDCGYMANDKKVNIVTESYRLLDVVLRGDPTVFPMIPVGSNLTGWQGGFSCGGTSITLYAGPDLVSSNHHATAIAKYFRA